jgi:hypothetical protein
MLARNPPGILGGLTEPVKDPYSHRQTSHLRTMKKALPPELSTVPHAIQQIKSHWFEFETEVPSQDENLDSLNRINQELLAKVEAMDSPQRVVRDIDTVYGEQGHSRYNGHFESTGYHQLLLFNGEGDCLAAKLRPDNVPSAEDWEEALLEVERQNERSKEEVYRGDANRRTISNVE